MGLSKNPRWTATGGLGLAAAPGPVLSRDTLTALTVHTCGTCECRAWPESSHAFRQSCPAVGTCPTSQPSRGRRSTPKYLRRPSPNGQKSPEPSWGTLQHRNRLRITASRPQWSPMRLHRRALEARRLLNQGPEAVGTRQRKSLLAFLPHLHLPELVWGQPSENLVFSSPLC